MSERQLIIDNQCAELKNQNFFEINQLSLPELRSAIEKTSGVAFIKYQKVFRVVFWQSLKENNDYIAREKDRIEKKRNQNGIRRILLAKLKLKGNISKRSQSLVKVDRDIIYTGGVYKPVNSYVRINESIWDEKTKYLYRDQPGIGLKKSDQIGSSQQTQGTVQVSGEKETFITKLSEHLIKCVVKEIHFNLGYNFRVLNIFQKDILQNSDFRIPQIWWKSFHERYRLLIAKKQEDLEVAMTYKINVFKYDYFLCPICIQYNCMIHKSCSEEEPLISDNWSPSYDKNVPKHPLNFDRINEFLSKYNPTNYASRYRCSDNRFCSRNSMNRQSNDLLCHQIESFNNINKRWINTLLYFAKVFSFLNPCFISLLLNISRPPNSPMFKCKHMLLFLVENKFESKRIEEENAVYQKCRMQQALQREKVDGNIPTNEYIQKKYLHLPIKKEIILSQLRELSEILRSTYIPCHHDGLCDGDSGCGCYRNRDLLEKIQKRIDKAKAIDKQLRKSSTSKQVSLELAFDSEDEKAKEDDEDNNPLYIQYQEIINKCLHECELYCGCPNYCRSKNKKLGCSCLNDMTCQSDKICQCRLKNRECDPETCRCFCNRNARTIQRFNLNISYCTNSQSFYNCKPKVLLGKSLVCEGLGLFAGQDFKKNAFIGCYIGELLDEKQGNDRQDVQQPQGISYLFMIHDNQDVDSFRYGNKMRYANHNCGTMANCKVDVVYSRGTNIVRFCASQDISSGQEIYFDYNRNYKIEWMEIFNKFYDKFEAEEKKNVARKTTLRHNRS